MVDAENVKKYYAGNPKLPNPTYEEENDILAVKNKTQSQIASFIVFNLFRNKKVWQKPLTESFLPTKL